MFRICGSNGGSWQFIVGRDHGLFRNVAVAWANAPEHVREATAEAWVAPPSVYLVLEPQ